MEQLWFPGYWELQGGFLFYSPRANLHEVTTRFQLPVTASTKDRHVFSLPPLYRPVHLRRVKKSL